MYLNQRYLSKHELFGLFTMLYIKKKIHYWSSFKQRITNRVYCIDEFKILKQCYSLIIIFHCNSQIICMSTRAIFKAKRDVELPWTWRDTIGIIHGIKIHNREISCKKRDTREN